MTSWAIAISRNCNPGVHRLSCRRRSGSWAYENHRTPRALWVWVIPRITVLGGFLRAKHCVRDLRAHVVKDLQDGSGRNSGNTAS